MITKDQAIAAGGNLWEKGSMSRVYLDTLVWARLVGFETYESRKEFRGIKSLDGEILSNAEEGRLFGVKVFVDDAGLHLETRYSVPRVISLTEIAARIEAAVQD